MSLKTSKNEIVVAYTGIVTLSVVSLLQRERLVVVGDAAFFGVIGRNDGRWMMEDGKWLMSEPSN